MTNTSPRDDDPSIVPPAVTASILPSGPGLPAPSMDPECLAVLAYCRFLSSQSAADADAHPLPPWLITRPPCLDVSSAVLGPEDGRLPVVRCRCGLKKSGALGVLGHFGLCDKMGGERSLDSWMHESQQSDCYA
jgi:hypothetical protein